MIKLAHPIHIHLIEEIPISEAGLRCMLEKEPDFKLLQHIQCGSECHLPCVNPPSDILLMVMSFESLCGLECIRRIMRRNADTKILVLCMIEDTHIAKRLLELGVKGVVCKNTPPNIIFRAIRKITDGEIYIDNNIARAIATQDSKAAPNPFSVLTHREYEISRLLLSGISQQQISKQLLISPHTVANHHAHILAKLHVSNHIELTKLAILHHVTSI